MQGSYGGLNGLWEKLRRKAKSNDMEAAGILLATKLYMDYIDVFRKSPGVEAEHFAEDWIKKNVPANYRVMKISIWRRFLCCLIERRIGKR